MNRALNASEMKIRNRARILKLIRQGGFARAEIARITGLTRAAVTVIIDECLARGMIIEGDKNNSAIGRKAIGLTMNGAYGWIVGLNISRRAYTMGAVDFSGKGFGEKGRELSPEESPNAVLEEICSEIRALRNSMSGKLLGIGITMPGPLDRKQGILLHVPNMQAWEGFPIKDFFQKKFGCMVSLDNNSNAMAKAEDVYNTAVQGKNFMELMVDSGLGSSIILNIDNRSVCFDCEYGHICVDVHGERCNCGNIGCAEMYASAPAILLYARSLDSSLSSWKDVAEGYLAGSATCKQIVDRELFYLSRVLINAVNCFDLDAVVFSGDIAYRFNELFLRPMEETILRESIRKKDLHLYTSRIQNAAILSAANLIIDRCLY